jgi:uncharacterized caspase-like protein
VGANDYAIVVGVERYPSFGRTTADPNDLQGPDNDARAVAAWLEDPNGGAVPAENLRRVMSGSYPDPFPNSAAIGPKPKDIAGAFRWLEGIAQRNNSRVDGPGLTVGHRLYLYMSGHGFAKKRQEAAVFTANATRSRPWHVEATSWAEWFYQAEYFEEYVVWMDCCMNPDLRIRTGPVGYRDVVPSKSPPLFSAFAARYPGQAVEAMQADGQVHGAFTWALLKGLRSAVDDAGAITSHSLKGYLVNAMATFMTDEQRRDERVSNEPDFGSEDDIVFATPPEPLFDVTVHLPPAGVGRRYQIVTGSPPHKARSGIVPSPTFTVPLSNGLYVITVPVAKLTGQIEVIGVAREISLA